MNFKKITAVVGSFLMAGMTLGVASAANFPAPFVADGVAAPTAIVHGADASLDMAPAGNIQTYLQEQATETGSSSASLGDESFLISGTGNDLTLGEALSDVKDKIDADEFPNLLADGVLEDDGVDYNEDEEIDYEQEIILAGDMVKFDSLGDDDDYAIDTDAADDELPVLHIDQSSGEAYNLTIDFAGDVNATAYDDSETITMFGKKLTFDPDMEMSDEELVFFEATETVNVGYKDSVTVNGDEISLEGVDTSAGTITLKINGQMYSEVETGDTEQGYYVNAISIDDLQQGSEGASVELFAGAKEWVIDSVNSPSDIEIDGDEVDGVQVYVEATDTAFDDIGSITFIVTPSDLDADEKDYLEVGEEMTDPLFDIKMVFDSVEPELKADSKEHIEVTADETIKFSFTSRNGNEYTVEPLQINDSSNDEIIAGDDWYIDSTNAGKLADLSKDSIFIAYEGDVDSSSEETLIYQVTNIDGDNDAGEGEVDFEDLSTGRTITVSQGDELEDTGLYLPENVSDGVTTINLSNSAYDTLADIRTGIVTDGGIGIEIPFLATNTSATTTWINFTEDRDGNINPDSEVDTSSIDINISVDSDPDDDVLDAVPNYNTSVWSVQNIAGDTDTEYALSELGTYVETDSDEYTSVDIWAMTEGQATYNTYLSSTSGATSDDGTSGDKGIVLYKDSETGYSDKNVIVVGGSCINTAAAALLGVAEGTCGDDFTAATDIASGEALIKGYETSDVTSEHALLVAGYSATDTKNAATYLQNEDVDTSEEYTVTSATSATMVGAE